MTAPVGSIAALDDKDAVRVPALEFDHQVPMPDGPTESWPAPRSPSS